MFIYPFSCNKNKIDKTINFDYTYMASASLDVPPRSRSAGEATKQVAPERFN